MVCQIHIVSVYENVSHKIFQFSPQYGRQIKANQEKRKKEKKREKSVVIHEKLNNYFITK